MAPAGGDVSDPASPRCEQCGADVTDELFCPACGAAVIPQKTKSQNRMAELKERTRHHPITRVGLMMGFFVGASIGLYLFTRYDAPKEAQSNRAGWGCFLAFFPFYGAAIGGGLGAIVSMLRDRRASNRKP
jgi:hypothetical protein